MPWKPFVDQQLQVRHGVAKNGTWHLRVAKSGLYKLQLRRWPRESGLPLTAGLPETRVTDGTYVAGKPLPIRRASIEFGNREIALTPDPDGTAFSTQVELVAGPLELRTTFFDQDGRELCGAYYVDVRRMESQR